MADSFVQLPNDGPGKKIDTRTEATNSEHRQVMVIGDPATNAGVAPVDATNGLAVQVVPALPAGTNVIGHVIADSGSTTAVTGNVTVVQGIGTNLHAVIDSGSTTVVTGNVTVVQGTGTNLHSVVDSGTVTSNQGTAAASTAGWPVTSGNLAESTAAWTSATSQNTTLRFTTTGYTTVAVTLNQGSTISGGVVTFEVSDTTAFTNAYPIQAVNSNTFTSATTYTLVASTNQAFTVNVAGYAAFQVRLSTAITGSATVNVGIAATTESAEPLTTVGGTVSSKTQDGSGTAITSNSTTTSGKAGLDVNLLSVLGTAPSTAGKVDVKGADGDVFVRQGTASNLKAQVTGAGSAGSADAGVVTIQGIASMTKVLVTPDSVALPAHQSTNVDQLNGNTISVGVGASGTGTARVVQANDAGKTLVSASGSVASSGNNTLVAAGSTRLKVYAFSLTTLSTTAVTCIFQSGASGTELWRVVLQAISGANSGANLSVAPPAWLFATASATLLNLNLSAAQTIHYSVSYYDEA